MVRVTCSLALLTLLLAAGAVAVTPSTGPADDQNASWDSYRIILTRNIFVRDRSRPSQPRSTSTRPVPRSSEQTMVLAGVVLQGPFRVAFFEDTRTGETVRACEGQELGDGTLVSISLDGVEYRSGDVTRKIVVGESVTRLAASPDSSSASSLPAPGTSEAASRPSDTTDTSTNDILERMRQKRLQELKQ